MEQKTCTIRLQDKPSGKKGILFFVEGELFDARVGDTQGVAVAFEILAWDQVSLSIQNDCSIRENRIRKDLYSLILEAARRKDEKTPQPSAASPGSGSEPPSAEPLAESLLRIRARIENELEVGCGVEDAFQDPVWNERVKGISRHGRRLKLGKLILAYVGRGGPRQHILIPGEPPSADAEHKYFIACQKELRDYDKVISGLRKKTKKVKVSKEQKAVRKEAEHLFKMFRAGEKLTTDDILLLQRSKLI